MTNLILISSLNQVLILEMDLFKKKMIDGFLQLETKNIGKIIMNSLVLQQ